MLASITQSIGAETAEKIALSFGAEVTRSGEGDEAMEAGALGVIEDVDDAEQLVRRQPVASKNDKLTCDAKTRRCAPLRAEGGA